MKKASIIPSLQLNGILRGPTKMYLTFTLFRLKQQNRQFSSNDQSDTVEGSRSTKTKKMTGAIYKIKK